MSGRANLPLPEVRAYQGRGGHLDGAVLRNPHAAAATGFENLLLVR